ncbi:MAG: signal peptidase I [Alphaproteobacteria bacterium]|nr:signal peptidase I [Alphaproteobacteria bacterium]
MNSICVTVPLFKRLKPCFAKSSLKQGGKAFVLTFLSVGFFSEQVHFIKSTTHSMPEHYFIHFPHVKPKRGDITLVYNSFYQGNLIKRIIGVEGDKISYDEHGEVWVGNKRVGTVYPTTRDGRSLKSIQPMIIPKGYVFLYAPHPRSFDSRYVEVGLVHRHQLQGRLLAVA